MPLTKQSGSAGFKNSCGTLMENHCLVGFHGVDDPEKSTILVVSGDKGESASRWHRESTDGCPLAWVHPSRLPLWADEAVPLPGQLQDPVLALTL